MRILEVIGGPASDNPLENALTDAIIAVSRGYSLLEIPKAAVTARVRPDPDYSTDEMAVDMALDALTDRIVKSHDGASIVLKSMEEQQEEQEAAAMPPMPPMGDIPMDDEMGGEFDDEFGGGGNYPEDGFPEGEVDGVDTDGDMMTGLAFDQAQDSMRANKKFSDEAVK